MQTKNGQEIITTGTWVQRTHTKHFFQQNIFISFPSPQPFTDQ